MQLDPILGVAVFVHGPVAVLGEQFVDDHRGTGRLAFTTQFQPVATKGCGSGSSETIPWFGAQVKAAVPLAAGGNRKR